MVAETSDGHPMRAEERSFECPDVHRYGVDKEACHHSPQVDMWCWADDYVRVNVRRRVALDCSVDTGWAMQAMRPSFPLNETKQRLGTYLRLLGEKQVSWTQQILTLAHLVALSSLRQSSQQILSRLIKQDRARRNKIVISFGVG